MYKKDKKKYIQLIYLYIVLFNIVLLIFNNLIKIFNINKNIHINFLRFLFFIF